MAFLIRPPGQVKKAKAKLKPKSKNAQEILNRLQGFLNQNTSEPVEILCSFWEDQRNAITYKELREVVQLSHRMESGASKQHHRKLQTKHSRKQYITT